MNLFYRDEITNKADFLDGAVEARHFQVSKQNLACSAILRSNGPYDNLFLVMKNVFCVGSALFCTTQTETLAKHEISDFARF